MYSVQLVDDFRVKEISDELIQTENYLTHNSAVLQTLRLIYFTYIIKLETNYRNVSKDSFGFMWARLGNLSAKLKIPVGILLRTIDLSQAYSFLGIKLINLTKIARNDVKVWKRKIFLGNIMWCWSIELIN